MAAPLTALDGMIAIGIDATIQAIGTSPAMRISSELFSNDFRTCMDLTDEQIDTAMKTFSALTQNEGRVRLMPGAVRRIKAYAQFICHHLRMGVNPSTVAFNPADEVVYNRQRATQKTFQKDSSDLASEAKPTSFTTNTNWIDWIKTFWNYLRFIPSREQIPLCHVIRTTAAPNRTPRPDFLDTCVSSAPLTGAAYNTDNMKVYILLKKLVEGNAEAEMIVLEFEAGSNGRSAVNALRTTYEGVGVHSVVRSESTHAIEKMFYSGEKPPNHTWATFEAKLKAACINYDKIDGRTPPDTAHSNEYRLDKLIANVKADFLQPVKAQIAVQMQMPGIVFTFQMALDAFRHAVAEKYGPTNNRNTTNHTKTTINEVGGDRAKQSGRGNPTGGGSGGGGPGARNKNQVKKGRPDSKVIRLKNGRWVDYHPGYRIPQPTWKLLPDWVLKDLETKRKAYNESKNGGRRDNDRHVEEMSQRIVENVTRQLSRAGAVPGSVDIDTGSTIASERDRNNSSSSQSRRSIMGGRNEQRDRRAERRGSRG